MHMFQTQLPLPLPLPGGTFHSPSVPRFTPVSRRFRSCPRRLSYLQSAPHITCRQGLSKKIHTDTTLHSHSHSHTATATQPHSHSISSPSSFLRPISAPLSHIRHSSLPSDIISPLTLARVSSNRTVVCSALLASTYACSRGKSRATSN